MTQNPTGINVKKKGGIPKTLSSVLDCYLWEWGVERFEMDMLPGLCSTLIIPSNAYYNPYKCNNHIKKSGSSKGPHMTLRGDMVGECKPLPILSTQMAKIPKTNTHPIQKTILVKQLVLSFSVPHP